MMRFLNKVRTRNRNLGGQTLVEYALILAIISVVAISALISLGNGVKVIYSNVSSGLASAAASH